MGIGKHELRLPCICASNNGKNSYGLCISLSPAIPGTLSYHGSIHRIMPQNYSVVLQGIQEGESGHIISSRSQSHMITFFFCSQVANSLCDQECQELCRGRVIDSLQPVQQVPEKFPRVQAFCPLLFKHQPLVHRVAVEWSCVVLWIAVGVGGVRQCSLLFRDSSGLTHFIALEE